MDMNMSTLNNSGSNGGSTAPAASPAGLLGGLDTTTAIAAVIAISAFVRR